MTNTKYCYKLMLNEYPDVLNADQVIDILRVSKKTLYHILKENQIQNIKIGREYRILKTALIDYLMQIA